MPTDFNGAAGTLRSLRPSGDTLAATIELPAPVRQLGAVDPLPAQDLVGHAAGSPRLVHLRKDSQLVRVPDDPPRRLFPPETIQLQITPVISQELTQGGTLAAMARLNWFTKKITPTKVRR